jgi:tetratricopeptide (TPR) repeat protein
MGNQLFDQGNYRESTVYYRRVLAHDSLNVPARIDLGVAYFNLGLSDSALAEMKKSLRIDPKHAKGLFNIGVIYYNMGRNSEAQKYWEQLIKDHDGTQEAQIARKMLENIKS